MILTRDQRAAAAWASQGRPVVMLTDMTEMEIDTLAALVDESGDKVTDFRLRFDSFFADYFDARKASVDVDHTTLDSEENHE